MLNLQREKSSDMNEQLPGNAATMMARHGDTVSLSTVGTCIVTDASGKVIATIDPLTRQRTAVTS